MWLMRSKRKRNKEYEDLMIEEKKHRGKDHLR